MKRKKRVVCLGVMLAMALLLSACSLDNSVNETKEPVTTSETPAASEIDTDEEMMEEFFSLLKNNTDSNRIYQFIETHSSKTDSEEMDTMVNGLLGYDKDIWAIDYERLLPLADKMSVEMQTFVTFMAQEQAAPAIKDGKIRGTLNKLLNDALVLERQMLSYPNGLTVSRAYELYCDYMAAAITGMYNERTHTKSVYLNGRQTEVSQSAIKSYESFVEEYPNSNTAKIVSNYLEILAKNNNQFTEEIKTFYENLYAYIRAQFKRKER